MLDAKEVPVHETVMVPAVTKSKVWWQVQNKNKITQESRGGHSRLRKSCEQEERELRSSMLRPGGGQIHTQCGPTQVNWEREKNQTRRVQLLYY